jgi:hypothetical protein
MLASGRWPMRGVDVVAQVRFRLRRGALAMHLDGSPARVPAKPPAGIARR